jgi:nitrite reductase (NADH) small subunit
LSVNGGADWVAVAQVDQVPPGAKMIVDVGGMEIGVFNIDGSFFALENVCPHQGGPLCEGDLFRHLDAEVTPEHRIRRFFRSEEHHIVACPWHGYEFDVRTGDCLVNPAYSAATLPAKVVGSEVCVALPAVLGA